MPHSHVANVFILLCNLNPAGRLKSAGVLAVMQHAAPGHSTPPRAPTHRFVANLLIVFHNAHALQCHEPAVRITVYHLRAHFVNA